LIGPLAWGGGDPTPVCDEGFVGGAGTLRLGAMGAGWRWLYPRLRRGHHGTGLAATGAWWYWAEAKKSTDRSGISGPCRRERSRALQRRGMGHLKSHDGRFFGWCLR